MRRFGVLLPVLAFLACFTTALPAQEHATDRGSLILGGDAGVTSSKLGDNRITFIGLNPAVQYFVQPGLAIGGSLGLAHTRHDESSSTSYGVGPKVSYYFGGAEQVLRPFVSGETRFTSTTGADYSALTYGGNAGVLYLLSRAVGLEASLFYSAISPRGDTWAGASSDAMGLAIGFRAFAF